MGSDGVCSADNMLWVVFDSFWVTLCSSPHEQLIPYAPSTNTGWAFLTCRVPSWPQKTGCLRLNGKGFPLSWVLFLNKQNAWWVLFSWVRLALRGRCNIWRRRKQLTMNGRCNRHSPVPPWSLNSGVRCCSSVQRRRVGSGWHPQTNYTKETRSAAAFGEGLPSRGAFCLPLCPLHAAQDPESTIPDSQMARYQTWNESGGDVAESKMVWTFGTLAKARRIHFGRNKCESP